MHWIQAKLIELAGIHDIANMRRADLVRLVGCNYQSQIDHHLESLKSKGSLIQKGGRLVPVSSAAGALLRIPIMGEADCGEATSFADGRVLDHLTISPSLSCIKSADNVYALIARGDSMNKATVAGKRIEDGDYVIVSRRDAYTPADNEIVVSNIGGLANIKRFKRDEPNKRIVLMPESFRQQDYAPIIISEDDEYSVLGVVVDVIKGV